MVRNLRTICKKAMIMAEESCSEFREPHSIIKKGGWNKKYF